MTKQRHVCLACSRRAELGVSLVGIRRAHRVNAPQAGAPRCAAAEAAAHLASRYAGATSGVSGRRLVGVAAKAAPATSRIAPVPIAAASVDDSAAPPPAAGATSPVPLAPAAPIDDGGEAAAPLVERGQGF